MNIYLRNKYLGAAYMTFSKPKFQKPLFSVSKYNKEYVIDSFLFHAVLTPLSALKSEGAKTDVNYGCGSGEAKSRRCCNMYVQKYLEHASGGRS